MKEKVNIFSTPRLASVCNGVPTYRYGYTDILGQGPDLSDFSELQKENDFPVEKIPLKRSIDLKFNYFGTTTPRMPRSEESDYLPLECGNLIDGNPETCWCSNGQARRNVEPIWIRLDFAKERIINRITLKKRPLHPRDFTGSQTMDAGAVEIGRGMPRILTVKVSRDGACWTEVFFGATEDTDGKEEFTLNFPPVVAKQVWIIGSDFVRVENWMFCFSVACVSVFDTKGREISLATYGTGISVSSSAHTFSQPREVHRWLWPLQYELGMKWARIGYHDDPINWHWVEREKGILSVDAETDAAIDDLCEHGVNICMVLAFGNRLYTDQKPRMLPQLHEWYYENPKPPSSEEALAAWERYISFMAEKYRNKVKCFEVWNESNLPMYWGDIPDAELFIKISERAFRVLREKAPEVPVMMGSMNGFPFGIAAQSDEEIEHRADEDLALYCFRRLAKQVDAIGWHPFYQADPEADYFKNYPKDVNRLREIGKQWGFNGEIFVSEYSYGAGYPAPTQPNWWGNLEISEMQKAKYVARLSVKHASMSMPIFFCETWNTLYALDLSLMRRTFASYPIIPCQPEPAFYVLRNLANMTDEYKGAEFSDYAEISSEGYETAALKKANGVLLSVWTRGMAKDDCLGKEENVFIKIRATEAIAFDPINGTKQKLLFDGNILKGVYIKDYPILIELKG